MANPQAIPLELLLANRDGNIAVSEKEKFSRFKIGESLPAAVRADYVLSSYEADVVKPLKHFSSIVADGAGRSCRSKSKAKIPRGSGVARTMQLEADSSPLICSKTLGTGRADSVILKLDSSS